MHDQSHKQCKLEIQHALVHKCIDWLLHGNAKNTRRSFIFPKILQNATFWWMNEWMNWRIDWLNEWILTGRFLHLPATTIFLLQLINRNQALSVTIDTVWTLPQSIHSRPDRQDGGLGDGCQHLSSDRSPRADARERVREAIQSRKRFSDLN